MPSVADRERYKMDMLARGGFLGLEHTWDVARSSSLSLRVPYNEHNTKSGNMGLIP